MLLAQTGNGGVDIGKTWSIAQNFPTLASLLSFLIPKVLIFGGVIFFIMIIIAGVGVITGAGSDDAQAQEKSKNFLTYAVIGLIIMIGAYWVLQIINVVTKGALKNLLGS